MAIAKKVTFEGNVYNLGNKDRVSAYSAKHVVSGMYASSSLHSAGHATAGQTGSVFVASQNYVIESAKFVPFVTSSAVASYMNYTVDANGSDPGSGTRVLSDNSNKGVRDSSEPGTSSTGSFNSNSLPAGKHLSVVATGQAGNFAGSYSVILSPE